MQNKDSLLREVRLSKGWSQLQLALEADVSLSTIERAEDGKGLRIDSIHRLCRCLGKTPAQLGLLKPDDYATLEDTQASYQEQSNEISEGNIESDDTVNRRKALKGALKLGVASFALSGSVLNSDALNRLEALLSRSSVDMSALESLETVTESHWRLLYGGVPKRGLLKSIIGHFESITDFLEGSSTTLIEQRLYALACQQTQMAGEIYFDLHDYDRAKAYTKNAVASAQRAANPELYAATLSRMSFLHTYSEEFEESLSVLRAAHHFSKQGPVHTIRCWMAAIEAEVYAKLYTLHPSSTSQDACLNLLEEAEAIAELHEEDPYRINFDSASLAAYKGVCFRYLHKPQEAQAVLQSALAALGTNQFVSQAQTLTDLASSYAQQGEVEEACSRACQALALAEKTKSVNTLRRILEFRKEVEPWSSTSYVEDLDAQFVVTRLHIA